MRPATSVLVGAGLVLLLGGIPTAAGCGQDRDRPAGSGSRPADSGAPGTDAGDAGERPDGGGERAEVSAPGDGGPGDAGEPTDSGGGGGDVSPDGGGTPGGGSSGCLLVDEGYGPSGGGEVPVRTVVSGLEVPWGIAFLPDGALLVTERPGRIRLVRAGQLLPTPVATVDVQAGGEGGLLGIALHPDFVTNRLFYVMFVVDDGHGGQADRVQRYRLEPDGRRAVPERVILDGIPAAPYHSGGRLRFGPDGMLYISSGDGRIPGRSRDLSSLGGKLLRLDPEGNIPADNPHGASSPVFLSGLRNPEGFDWFDRQTLFVVDHGPSGELDRAGGDEVNVARAGDDLGWPTTWHCDTQAGLVTPLLTWQQAVPPGGAAWYTGDAIPAWRNSLLVGTLGSRHLHRVVVARGGDGLVRLTSHEVHFSGDPPAGYGRLREVIQGPDGALYVTTSNCDGRGTCPADKDRILRLGR